MKGILKSKSHIIYAQWLLAVLRVAPEGFSTPSKQTASAANRAAAPAVYYSMSSAGRALNVCAYVCVRVRANVAL